MDAENEPSTPTRSISKQGIYQSVVPWQSPEQFIKVYKCLYSPSVSDQRWAVNQIAVWETRCHPSLPTAIEATVVIVRAFIQDILCTVEKSFCDEKDVQMLFAMALVRFVNLILEIDQKSEYKINLKALAEKRKLPSWIVDLRHEVTHTYLPSLPVLRLGAKAALNYLEESFWKVEAENIRPIVLTPTGIEEVVRNVIAKYKDAQICLILGIGDVETHQRDAREIVKEIRSLADTYRQKFVDAFVQPDVFLCAKDIIQLVENRDALFLEDDETAALPDVLETAWIGVLKIFHSLELIPYFMEVLLLNQENYSNLLCKKTASAWALFLLNAVLTRSNKSRVAKRFQKTGVQLNLKRLLYASMKGANKFTLDFFTRVVSRLGNHEKYNDVCRIFSVYQGMDIKEDTKGKQPEGLVFTVEDLESDIDYIRKSHNQTVENKNDDGPKWFLAPVSMNFADQPLGAIINPEDVEEISNTSTNDVVDMDTSLKEEFIHLESYHQEPTIEENIESDTNFFIDPEIGNMLYRM